MWTDGTFDLEKMPTRTTDGSGRRSRAYHAVHREHVRTRRTLRGGLQKYSSTHGTTLRALIDEYEVDLYDFLDFAHDTTTPIRAQRLGEAIERVAREPLS